MRGIHNQKFNLQNYGSMVIIQGLDDHQQGYLPSKSSVSLCARRVAYSAKAKLFRNEIVVPDKYVECMALADFISIFEMYLTFLAPTHAVSDNDFKDGKLPEVTVLLKGTYDGSRLFNSKTGAVTLAMGIIDPEIFSQCVHEYAKLQEGEGKYRGAQSMDLKVIGFARGTDSDQEMLHALCSKFFEFFLR